MCTNWSPNICLIISEIETKKSLEHKLNFQIIAIASLQVRQLSLVSLRYTEVLNSSVFVHLSDIHFQSDRRARMPAGEQMNAKCCKAVCGDGGADGKRAHADN